jgi:hypothetical protein
MTRERKVPVCVGNTSCRADRYRAQPGFPVAPGPPGMKKARHPSEGATIGTCAVCAPWSAGSGVRAARWMNNGRLAPTTVPPVTRSCRRSVLGAGRCTSRGRCGCHRRRRSWSPSARSTGTPHTTTARRPCSLHPPCPTLVVIGMPKPSGRPGYAGDACADGRRPARMMCRVLSAR